MHLLLNKQYPLITLSDAYITDEIIYLSYNSNNLVVALNSVFQEFIPLYIQSTFQPLPFWIILSVIKEFNSSIATFLFRPVRWL